MTSRSSARRDSNGEASVLGSKVGQNLLPLGRLPNGIGSYPPAIHSIGGNQHLKLDDKDPAEGPQVERK